MPSQLKRPKSPRRSKRVSPEVQRPGWEVGSPTLPWLRAQLSAASWWPHLNTATNRLASIHSLFLSPKLCLRDSSGLLKKVSAARLALTSLPEFGIFSHGGVPSGSRSPEEHPGPATCSWARSLQAKCHQMFFLVDRAVWRLRSLTLVMAALVHI